MPSGPLGHRADGGRGSAGFARTPPINPAHLTNSSMHGVAHGRDEPSSHNTLARHNTLGTFLGGSRQMYHKVGSTAELNVAHWTDAVILNVSGNLAVNFVNLFHV